MLTGTSSAFVLSSERSSFSQPSLHGECLRIWLSVVFNSFSLWLRAAVAALLVKPRRARLGVLIAREQYVGLRGHVGAFVLYPPVGSRGASIFQGDFVEVHLALFAAAPVGDSSIGRKSFQQFN